MKFRNNYNGIVAQTYDVLYSEESARKSIDFYKQLIEETPGPVLEIACGTGRITMPLLKQGIDIEGLDNSQEMLDILLSKAAKDGLNIKAHKEKMQDFQLNKKFSIIIVPYSSFLLLIDRTDSFNALKNFYDHLTPGGQLIIEAFIPYHQDGYIHNLRNKSWNLIKSGSLEDGSTILVSAADSYNDMEKLLTGIIRYEIIKNGKVINTELQESILRIYSKYELELLLENAGFEVKNIYGDHTFELLKNEHKVMIFQGIKK